VLNKQKVTNPKSAGAKITNPAPACTAEELTAYIQGQLQAFLNNSDIVNKLEDCGYSPQDLAFSFKLSNPSSTPKKPVPPRTKTCPGCVCTCWDPALRRWVDCPCPY
jgi:hypothetical protein